MYSAIAAGVESTGSEIRYVGLVPTDVVYSLSGLLDLPGLIITASQSKEYTGVKLCNSGAKPIGENSGLNEIKNIIFEMKDDDLHSRSK